VSSPSISILSVGYGYSSSSSSIYIGWPLVLLAIFLPLVVLLLFSDFSNSESWYIRLMLGEITAERDLTNS